MPQPSATRLPLICGAIPVGLRAPAGAARKTLSGPTVPVPAAPIGNAGVLPAGGAEGGMRAAALPGDALAAAGRRVVPPVDLAGGSDAADADLRHRALLLAVLARPRYPRAVLAGCDGGALAIELALRCDRLTLVAPTETARSACVAAVVATGLGDRLAPPRVGAAPDDWPDESADLVVLDDYACWFDAPGFARLIAHVLASLVPGGELVCRDPRLPPAEAPLTGDYVHARLRHELALDGLLSHVERDFRIDSWTRLPDGG